MIVGGRNRGLNSGQGLKFCRIEVIDIIEVMKVDKLNKRIINFYKKEDVLEDFGGWEL